jgi:hypothetical protein
MATALNRFRLKPSSTNEITFITPHPIRKKSNIQFTTVTETTNYLYISTTVTT